MLVRLTLISLLSLLILGCASKIPLRDEKLALPNLVIDCESFKSYGCLIVPNAYNEAEHELIVYIRGFWGIHKGMVPNNLRVDSARQAINKFKLAELANNSNKVVFVIASSHLWLSKELLKSLAQVVATHTNTEKLEFSNVILAAHSGGYKGLMPSIDMLLSQQQSSLVKIIMLDSYYSSDVAAISRASNEKIACVGFLTKHNKARFDSFYSKIGCVSDGPEGFQHSASVAACLAKYVNQNSCID